MLQQKNRPMIENFFLQNHTQEMWKRVKNHVKHQGPIKLTKLQAPSTTPSKPRTTHMNIIKFVSSNKLIKQLSGSQMELRPQPLELVVNFIEVHPNNTLPEKNESKREALPKHDIYYQSLKGIDSNKQNIQPIQNPNCFSHNKPLRNHNMCILNSIWFPNNQDTIGSNARRRKSMHERNIAPVSSNRKQIHEYQLCFLNRQKNDLLFMTYISNSCPRIIIDRKLNINGQKIHGTLSLSPCPSTKSAT